MLDITTNGVIAELDIDFVRTFKFAHIFNSAKSAIIIDNDDCVHVFGNNDNGCLGLGHEDSVSVATKLDPLCQKRVTDVIDSDWLIKYALTSDGLIYFWGFCHVYGFLGSKRGCVKPTVIESMIDEFVIDLKCGHRYFLALTINGMVYEWGFDEAIRFPRIVSSLKLHAITAISCGYYHSLVLTDDDEVFGWGRNQFGQIGSDSYNGCGAMIKLNGFGNDKAIQISCGHSHSMILTECGHVFLFGCNKFGQLGSNGRSDKTNQINSLKFIEIATQAYYSYMSVGLSNDGYCYVWGKVGQTIITDPNKTLFKSIEDVIQHYNNNDATYKCLYFKEKFDNLSADERLEQSFDKQECSDISFKIDGKHVFVQKQHIMSVCKHFEAMFADNVWLESNANEIEITHCSYSVYYSFLKYLYTDSVQIQSKHLIDLYDLANSYFEERLKQKCVENMKYSVNVKYVFSFYSFAINHGFNKLEKLCFNYIKDNMSDVVKTDAYLQTNECLSLKKFVSTLAKNGNLPKK